MPRWRCAFCLVRPTSFAAFAFFAFPFAASFLHPTLLFFLLLSLMPVQGLRQGLPDCAHWRWPVLLPVGRLQALVAPLLVGAWRLLLVVVDPIVVALLVQPLVDVVDQLILGWLVLLVLLAVAVELLVLAVDMHPSAWAQAFRLLVVVAGGVVAVATSVSATLSLVEALLGGMATSVSALVEALLLTFWLPSSG